MLDQPRIGAHHIHAVLAGVPADAVDGLLRDAGVAPGGGTSPEQFTRLVRAVWELLDDELMGQWPVPSRRGTFATMGLLAVHSPDLHTALSRALGFYNLFPGGPRFRLLDTGEDVFRLELEPGPGLFLTESLLLIWHRFASWLIRAPLRPVAVELAYGAPEHHAEYPLIFGAPAVFDQSCSALVLPRSALQASVQRDERALAAFLRNSPADLLARREHGTSFASAVRRVVEDELTAAGSLPSLPRAANRLSFSPATLRRYLAAESTSYTAVCDALRRDLAMAGLTDGRESLSELAARLGFSETSALHRAFRRWTGHSPRSYLSAP
ncbi:MAG: AraC family transcriptional regulator [Mycobacteriaceae bacterium]